MKRLKKHILSMILYILGFVTITLLLLLLEQPFLLAFLVVYILIPCILLPLFFRSADKAIFRAYCPAAYVEKEHDIPLYFELKNPTICPFFLCEIEFKVKNLYYDNEYEHNLAIHVLPKHTEKIKVPIENMYIGMVKTEVTSVSVTDLLHFFTYSFPEKHIVEVPVFPTESEQEDLPATPSSDGLDEFTESDLKGNISSDIKEIRPYQPGDRLQRIHWKLSAKLDDLFVKEMAHTSVLSLVLLPELERDHIEATVSTLLGCIKTLQAREERFELCLFNSAAVDFSFLQLIDEEAKTEALIRLYYLPLYSEKSAALDAFRNSGVKKATVISIYGEEITIYPSEL
ncbi:MAG: DUF58 domain-containing protein [Lachnospiraceae bacterium]|nr:DUF58 domain-containing protein [Lachnospiraceae bacterium]